MSKEEFIELCDFLRPFIKPNPLAQNCRTLLAEIKIALTLFFFKILYRIYHNDGKFRIHQSTVSKVIVEICTAVVRNLIAIYVTLSKTKKMALKGSKFEVKCGMSEAYECIYYTHVPIKALNENGQDYFSYGSVSSMYRLFMIIVDVL